MELLEAWKPAVLNKLLQLAALRKLAVVAALRKQGALAVCRQKEGAVGFVAVQLQHYDGL